MSLRERVRGWMPVLVAGGVLAIGGIAAIPLGGWDTVDLASDDIPEQAIGEQYAGAQWNIAIDDAYLTDEHPDGFSELDPGDAYLVVVATLENVRSEPAYPLGSSSTYPFTIPGVIERDVTLSSGAYSLILERDLTYASALNRGVPDTVLFVFTTRASLLAAGDEVRIGLTDGTPEEADIIEGTRWVDVHTAAEVVVTLRDES
jgi:hypothetical protein